MNPTSKHPLVSVIIPAYNQGPMLARAIEGALAQTYPHVEVIVVNDGSPSAITRETAQAYEGHIIYVERENGGVAAARNTGLASATGELIAWLDQDDGWLPSKLQMQVAAIQAHPKVALVHTSYYHTDDAGKRTGGVHLPEREWHALPDLLVEGTICTSSVLMPKRILVESGGMDAELPGADDWDLYLRLAAAGYRFYCIERPLAEYRLHAGNTARKPDLMITVWLRMLDKFYALPNLSQRTLLWRGRAYFQKYMAAAALYYGSGELEEAKRCLQSAAECYPQGFATGRTLQSLVYSKAEQPSQATVEDTLHFVDDALAKSPLAPGIARKLEARKSLIRALHAGKVHPVQTARHTMRALSTDPALLVDPELWAAGRRLLGKSLPKLKRKITIQSGRLRRAAKR
jgi:glycosyltransferase involved in cell wall biosynthesis